MFGAFGLPSNRAMKAASRFEDEWILPVDKNARSKSAADVAGDNSQRLRRYFQDVASQTVTQTMHALASRIEDSLSALGVEHSHGSAGFEEVCNHPGVDDLDSNDTRG